MLSPAHSLRTDPTGARDCDATPPCQQSVNGRRDGAPATEKGSRVIVSSPEPLPAGAIGSGQPRGDHPLVVADPLYGRVRVAAWAAPLLATAPFARLAAISLSDVPGNWLFGTDFPSRLEHALGVYHLARLCRPRDRLLQAAALAHDLGHGPFSHLSEALMRSELGCDHEERAARQLAAVRAALPLPALRRLDWLDWNEVAALILGQSTGVESTTGSRGALLNGLLDYDNIDHVARFLLAADLGQPGYDPLGLARALRLAQPEPDAGPGEDVAAAPTYLLPAAESWAVAWQASRRKVYGFLHREHRNLAPHAMLRRMIALAALQRTLPPDFLNMTDASAIAALAANSQPAVASLAQRVLAGPAAWHVCQWEADLPADTLAALATGRADSWKLTAELEQELASEAGLASHEVIVEFQHSSSARALPPFSGSGRPQAFVWLPPPRPVPDRVHVFVGVDTPRDYRHRLRTAAERRLGGLGVAAPPSA